MRSILCFGDSNTWGGCRRNEKIVRFDTNTRWTKLLQKKLGEEFCVIEEGLNGRTLVSHRPDTLWRAGYNFLQICLETHSPLDLIIVMLGTNDLFSYYSNSLKQVGEFLEQTIDKIKLYKYPVGLCPEILIISPPRIDAKLAVNFFEVDESSERKSVALETEYEKIAKQKDCYFLSALNLPVGSDGLHLNEEAHSELANIVYKKIMEIIK